MEPLLRMVLLVGACFTVTVASSVTANSVSPSPSPSPSTSNTTTSPSPSPSPSPPSNSTTTSSHSLTPSPSPTNGTTPTLTPSPANSTTPTPTSTHFSPTPTPTPTSTPNPEPREELYNVTTHPNGTGQVCIKMNASIAIAVNFTNGSSTTAVQEFDIAGSVDRTQSFCDGPTDRKNIRAAQMVINTANETVLKFVFQKNTENMYQWWLQNITFNFSSSLLPNYTNSSTFNVIAFWNVSSPENSLVLNEFQRSYKCDMSTNVSLKLNHTGINSTAKMTIHQWQVQAFEFRKDGVFGNARLCNATGAPNIVPIAVGVVLVLLIVVVLAAYVLGRVRSRRKTSYESLS